jgi:hypothetical protein
MDSHSGRRFFSARQAMRTRAAGTRGAYIRRDLGGLFLFGAGLEFSEWDFDRRIESVQRDDNGDLALVIDARYQKDAASPADQNTFNQGRDMHRARISCRTYKARGGLAAARLRVI